MSTIESYVGIDPGLTGAIAVLDNVGSAHIIVDIPVEESGKGKIKNRVNTIKLGNIFDDILGIDDYIIYLERVHSLPNQGVQSMFSMGDTYGCIRGVLGYHLIKPKEVMAKEWKKHFNLTSDKEDCRLKAIELFPEAEEYLKRKKDHNRAEALLIAKYGYDVELNKEREKC